MKNQQFPANQFNSSNKIDTSWSVGIQQRFDRLGIPHGIFTSEVKSKHTVYTDDELEAMSYIYQGLELPKDLESRLLETLPERIKRNEEREKMSNNEKVPESIIEKTLGIKLK